MGVSALELRRRVLMAQPHKERKTGGIVSFSTHVPQVLDVSVPLSPVQAGTGDPYPPGGGKNKLSVDIDVAEGLNPGFTRNGNMLSRNGVDFTFNDDGTIKVNGTATGNYSYLTLFKATFLSDSPSGTYVLNGCPSGGSASTYNIDVAGASGCDSGNGISLTYTGTLTNVAVRIRVTENTTVNNLIFKPMIRLASESDATFAPYSNIRPISGHTGAAVCRTGKNLLDMSILRQGTFEGIANPNNVSFDEFLPIKGGLQYVWSTTIPNISGRYIRFYDATKTMIGTGVSLYWSGAKKFTAPENAVCFKAMWYRSGGLPLADVTEDQIEPGATASEYAPYSGESFPFTFPAVGVNQWDEEWENGSYSSSTGEKQNDPNKVRSKNLIPVIPGETYYFVAPSTVVGYKFNANKEFVSSETIIADRTFTVPNGVYYLAFNAYNAYGTTYNHNISINYPSTATAYEPYTNTVYGGRLEPAAGRVVVEWAREQVLTGSDNGITLGKELLAYRVPNKKPGLGNFISNLFVKANADTNYSMGGRSTTNVVEFRIAFADLGLTGEESSIVRLNAFKAWLAENPTYICYELADPLIVPLSPAEIRALMGENNVFADAGDVDVEFWTN